jgi:putative aldouronate transport system permease protein
MESNMNIKPVRKAKVVEKRKRNIIDEYIKHKYFFLMLLPVIVYFGLFHYGPMYGIIIAFKDFYPLKGVMGSEWVGLKHFHELVSGMFFWSVFKNTIIISFYKLIFGFPAPIILAILINEVRNLRFKKFIQTVTYLPHFISWIVLAGIVIEVLSPSRGPFNILLQSFGLNPIFFIGEPKLFRGVLVLSSIWKEVGWGTIIYLAGMSGIDPELYDVAELDGANRFRKILNVTLPSIAPVIVIMLIFASGSIINDDFDQIYNMMNSRVMPVADVISTYTYREGFTKMNYSFATAVGLFKNVIAFTLVLITNFIAKRSSEYSIW